MKQKNNIYILSPILILILILLSILYFSTIIESIVNSNNNRYTAIIVEPRKHKALELVLLNVLTNLDDNWDIIIFHGNLNKEYIQNIVDKQLSRYKSRIKMIS